MVHRLAQYQMKKALRADGSLDIDALIEAISQSYDELDRERRTTDHAITVMVEDLEEMERGLKQKREEVEETTKWLQLTLDNVSQGVMTIGSDYRIRFFNEKFAELTGMQSSDFAGNPDIIDVLQKMIANGEYDKMSPDFGLKIIEATINKKPYSGHRVRKDGSVIELLSYTTPDGSVVRTVTDITRHIESNKRIENLSSTLRSTLDNISEGVLLVDAQGTIMVLNHRANEVLGIPADVLKVNNTMQQVVQWQVENGELNDAPPEVVKQFLDQVVPKRNYHYERRTRDGRFIEVHTRILSNGSVVMTYKDVSEAHARALALRNAEEEYRALFDNATVGLYRVSVDGRFLAANAAFGRIQGYNDGEEYMEAVKDSYINGYVDPHRRNDFIAILMRDGRVSDFVSEVLCHKTRTPIWISESAWVVCDQRGRVVQIEGMIVDATERKTAQDAIERMAMHDMLTGLPNRNRFMRLLGNMLTDTTNNSTVAVFYMDLDRFKDINDTMGHESGDILLRLVARRLQRLLPKGCIASRFGGDEFALALTGLEQNDVKKIAESIVQRLCQPFRINSNTVYIGVSIGIAFAHNDGFNVTELLKKADIALYRTKEGGRGTYMVFDPQMTEALQARRTIEVELRRAVANEEFRVVYQPIIDVTRQEPVGYEALLRWQHPVRGRLTPFEFIEVSEDSGLIIPIGEWVLNEACRQVAKLPGMPFISVNLSPVQFRNHQLGSSVVAALAASGLPPHRLVLEITESVLLHNDARTMNVLQQLRALGVKIALDDFGAGHSSFSYLQKFPFDKIKIDRAFVNDRGNTTMNRAIRRAVLGLGRDLNVAIVAEGVETFEQSQMLISEGCRYMQGYLFGKPADPAVIFASLQPKAEQQG